MRGRTLVEEGPSIGKCYTPKRVWSSSGRWVRRTARSTFSSWLKLRRLENMRMSEYFILRSQYGNSSGMCFCGGEFVSSFRSTSEDATFDRENVVERGGRRSEAYHCYISGISLVFGHRLG